MTVMTDMPLLAHRKTKIVATLGPASNSVEVIRDLITAGVNVFRLNMSHGEHAEHQRVYGLVRQIADELKQSVAIFADLCGPKIRVGQFKQGKITLNVGETVVVTTREVEGEEALIPSQYAALANDVKVGDRILMDDGNLELQVTAINGEDISCQVIFGGVLKNHKGINLPGVNVSCPALTDKDREDARFALGLGVDYLALSFVRAPEDIWDLRRLITQYGADTHIIAKIEKPEALTQIRAILEATDALMIARGDLGVELNPEDVPIAQQQLIKLAREYNKPVIVATQMLESMITNARPTRAEVTDVSIAVSAGADAVMLSAETAAGNFPVEAVAMMARVIKQTEAFMSAKDAFRMLAHADISTKPVPYGDAVADATAKFCADLQAKAIVVMSNSGKSAMTLCAARPIAPLLAICPSLSACQRMNLYWGAMPFYSDEAGRTHPNLLTRRVLQTIDFVQPGDNVILVRGFHADPHVNSPTITMLMA